MQDCGHATPIENHSPAGKAQKQVRGPKKNQWRTDLMNSLKPAPWNVLMGPDENGFK